MALKDFVGKGARPETEMSPRPAGGEARPAAPPPPVERRSGPGALLDASVQFKGVIRCQESIRIDGRCEGELYSDHAVIIGEPAVLNMAIEADSVVIAGEVNGDITAHRKITLEPSARVTGNLCTPGIVIQEGAKLEGRIMIDSEVESGPPAKPERPAAAAASPASATPKPPEKPRTPTPSAPPPAS